MLSYGIWVNVLRLRICLIFFCHSVCKLIPSFLKQRVHVHKKYYAF
ncbi:hypothetical protein RchiOBHm_Chr5g0019131 [Rosa chinensis]|uniref:Uncharacterized protein n=1 Tax=Rosa chinensis TaxID=74649 RepID=A0A2P6Q6Y3_ROSCH|nr:hypothetical protein RchiOBHm_Chr5g0019131 [Rosa chinensis]